MHYLFHRTPGEEEGCQTDAPRHYWMDFADAAAVIDAIRPDRLLFMALDGAWAIALNAVARRRGIPTFVLGHGHLDADAENVPLTVKGSLAQGSPLPAVRFVHRSLGMGRLLATMRTMRFMADARRIGEREAMHRHRFEERMPKYYVALSPDNAEVYRRRDQAPATRVACIGLPEHDRLFGRVPPGNPAEGAVLLVDSPTAENRWDETTTTIDEKVAFLRSLDQAAGALGRPLRVKLHPETYQAGWLPNLAHGTYLRDADLVAEFETAAICVGFDSTLMIPAVWLRPTVLIRLRPYSVIDIAAETGAAVVASSMEAVDAELLESARLLFCDSTEGRKAYSRRLAFKTDGHAIDRLRSVIDDPEAALRRYSLAVAEGQTDGCGAN